MTTLCTLSQFNHILRGVPPAKQTLVMLSKTILDSVCTIGGIDKQLEKAGIDKSTFDPRRLLLNKGKGGCGIPGDHPKDSWCSASAAYCGSIALTIAVVKLRFIPSLEERHFTDPSLPGLEAYTNSLSILQLTTSNLLPHSPIFKAMSNLMSSIGADKITHSAIPKVQHKFREIYQSFSQRMVLDSLPKPRIRHRPNVCDKAVLTKDE